jgi:hypothetical protein
MALADTIADWVIKALSHDGSNRDVVTVLRRKHPGELLVLYFNWQSRLIPSQPRRVMRVECDDPLLFVMFRADKAYLLDIGTHKTFEDDRLAQIAISNGQTISFFSRLKASLVFGEEALTPATNARSCALPAYPASSRSAIGCSRRLAEFRARVHRRGPQCL